MGNYKARREGFLNSRQLAIADWLFRGYSDNQIIEKVFPDAVGNEQKTKYAHTVIRNTIRNPKFIEYYKTMITEWSVHNHGKALNRLSEQLDSNEPWLLNKAINDTLNRTSKLLLGDEENSVVIRVEGAPTLGSPSDEEDEED